MIDVVHNMTDLMFLLLLTSARIAAVLIIAPFFSSETVPGILRNMMIFTLSVMVVPLALEGMHTVTLTPELVFLILLKEVMIGFTMGIVVGIAFNSVQSMGDFLDNQRGASIGQTFDPSLGEMGTPLSIFFVRYLLVIFFIGGGFFAFLTILYKSFVVWPIFSYFPNFRNPLIPKYTLELADIIMKNTVLLSAPIVIVMFLAEFGMGMMNRFAQQLNVFQLAMPIKSALAIFMLVLYISLLYTLFQTQLLEDRKLLLLLQKIF